MTFSSDLKIAVVGSDSMVGSRFCELEHNEFKLIKADLGGEVDIDITNPLSVKSFFKRYKFDWLVLFSAFTDVDKAEQERNNKEGACWRINVDGAYNIASACKRYDRFLIYISTDFVFDGISGPYSENDEPASDSGQVSWYGWTKLNGEKTVINSDCKFIIARISYPYRAKFLLKTDFVRNILDRLKTGNLYPMYDDQLISPTFIDNIVRALACLIKAGQFGIFHIADNTVLSPYQAACEIARVFGYNACSIKRGSLVSNMKDSSFAKRPLNGGLKNNRVQNLLVQFGFSMLDFKNSLILMKQQIESDNL
ncbi:MAG: SDR family oxidoreductase [Candidatus Aenigmatarchaeota archaeon]